jgi:hypothetical protein
VSKYSITGQEAIESADAIKRLSIVDKDGKALYKFDAKAKIVFAKRLKKLIEVVQLLDEQREALLKECGLDKKQDDKEAIEKFNIEYKKMLEVKHDVECGAIKEEWLQLDKNADIPHTLLVVLDWMIEYTTEGLD